MFNLIPALPKQRRLPHRFFMYMTIDSTLNRKVIRWQAEPHLQRNFDLYSTQHQDFAMLMSRGSERGVVEFWLDMALNNFSPLEAWEPKGRVSKALRHLSLYCEESCYRAASLVWKDDKYRCWEEYIFLARCLVYDTARFQAILTKYNPSDSPLDVYMTEVLRKTIKDEATVAKFSRWRLLCKKSDKELREALVRYGRLEPEISRFLFARKYFKQIYQASKIQTTKIQKRWVDPDITDFNETAQVYNAQKLLSMAPHQVAVGVEVSGDEIQRWMEICILALQNYPKSITPSVSFEAMHAQGYEIESSSLYDDVSGMTSYVNSLWGHTDSVLQDELLKLNSEQQEIIYMYYALRWNQNQIAAKFGVTQGAIARRLQTIERRLIQAIFTIKQPPQWVKQYIASWLYYDYETPDNLDLIHAVLVASVKRLKVEFQDLLRLHYAQRLDVNIIATRLGISPDGVDGLIYQAQCELELLVLKEIDILIGKFLNAWLIKQYKNNHKFVSAPDSKQLAGIQ
jgi:RNA polymerase sigma factor (sigma-70 family)